MPHEERMLKSAYKTGGKGGSISDFPTVQKNRQAGLSMTPYMKKGNDLIMNHPYTGGMNSPEMGHYDNERKLERSQHRWETVMSHKH